MDRKELKMRWALSQINPKYFYLPHKNNKPRYTVLFEDDVPFDGIVSVGFDKKYITELYPNIAYKQYIDYYSVKPHYYNTTRINNYMPLSSNSNLTVFNCPYMKLDDFDISVSIGSGTADRWYYDSFYVDLGWDEKYINRQFLRLMFVREYNSDYFDIMDTSRLEINYEILNYNVIDLSITRPVDYPKQYRLFEDYTRSSKTEKLSQFLKDNDYDWWYDHGKEAKEFRNRCFLKTLNLKTLTGTIYNLELEQIDYTPLGTHSRDESLPESIRGFSIRWWDEIGFPKIKEETLEKKHFDEMTFYYPKYSSISDKILPNKILEKLQNTTVSKRKPVFSI